MTSSLRTLSFLLWYNFPVIWIARLKVPALVLLIFISYSCTRPATSPESKVKILTTIAPLYCFTINITGDTADLENLLPAGVGPHEYSLSPGDAKKIASAQIIVKNGVNLEMWLDKALGVAGMDAPETGKTVVNTSDGINIIDGDPHIWLSPRNAMIQVQNIRNALVEADPDNRIRYEGNAALYMKELKALDREIREEVKQWTGREFVSFLPAFKYLAEEYGLVVAAVIQETPEVEPAPKHIAEVINIIQSKKMQAVFTEPMISHKIVDSLAGDLQIKVLRLDTLETGSPDRTWYVDKMKMNLAELKKVLEKGT